MHITFLTRKSALIYRRGLRQRVASLTLNCNGDFAIRAYGSSSLPEQYVVEFISDAYILVDRSVLIDKCDLVNKVYSPVSAHVN